MSVADLCTYCCHVRRGFFLYHVYLLYIGKTTNETFKWGKAGAVRLLAALRVPVTALTLVVSRNKVLRMRIGRLIICI
jgi:hypothetical protein